MNRPLYKVVHECGHTVLQYDEIIRPYCIDCQVRMSHYHDEIYDRDLNERRY